MSKSELDLHVRAVGWLHIVGGLLFVAAGLFLFLFFAGIGVGSGELQAMGVLGAIGFAGAVFLCLVALPGLITGWAILNRKHWARMMGIVVGVLELAAVPIGTIMGGYTLYVLTDKNSADYFEESKRAE